MTGFQRTIIILMAFYVGVYSYISGQEKAYSPKEGLELFKSGNYVEAEKAYEYLLEKYPKDSRYNFYMGICEMKNRSNIPEAIKRLNYSRIKSVSRDVYFYLGRAHHLSYHFDEAISNYKKFIQYTSNTDNRVDEAKGYITECENGKKISTKIYNIKVIDKTITPQKNLLDRYYPARDVGKLYKNGDFFESGVNPSNIMFETERGDMVYFTMKSNEEDSMSIYRMVKLIDGWGNSESVGSPVNSVYNDAYPFIGTDGLTFYFSSDRPGGMGGFDIYKVYFDNVSQSFLEPINMGVPFNSPDDDFLFVSDEFNKVAWFSSNRETSGDQTTVYTIEWDGTQVRNMVDNANQINEAAQLNVVVDSEVDIQEGDDFTYNRDKRATVNKEAFSFEINDTITYTKNEHFLNAEALEFFKKGHQLKLEKDSLSRLMRAKRTEYSTINNPTEKNKIVNEILALENQVYSLDDKVEEDYMYARQREVNEIYNRIEAGTFNPSKQVQSESTESLYIDGIFIPEKYSVYTIDEFERYYSKYQKMYEKLFSKNDKKSLHYADSLYVWANILNLESSQLLAKSHQTDEETKIKLSELIKRANGHEEEPEESTTEKLIKESKQLKILSNRIYHKALDKKYPIYWLKLKDISAKLDDDKGSAIEELNQQGNAYYREAKRALNTVGGLNVEDFEKAGTMKKAAIESQENALQLYCDMLDQGYTPVQRERKPVNGVVQKSYSEIHRGVQKPVDTTTVEKEPEANSAKVVNSNSELNDEYRIQIGVFRNPPNPEALSEIAAVSSIELEGRGLIKYFSGHYKTKDEALGAISKVVEAGFAGAFVVYFKDGKPSAMPK